MVLSALMKMLKFAVGDVIVRIWAAEVKDHPGRPVGTFPRRDKSAHLYLKITVVFGGNLGEARHVESGLAHFTNFLYP